MGPSNEFGADKIALALIEMADVRKALERQGPLHDRERFDLGTIIEPTEAQMKVRGRG